jgi:hypothetical protein
MDEKTRKREHRLRKHQERLRSTKPAACVVCGEQRPNRLESHHVDGRRYGKKTGSICKNHHSDITDERDQLPPIFDPPDPLERIANALLNEAALYKVLSEERQTQGEWLLEQVKKSVPTDPDDLKREGT